jgi:hypothetical protein
MNIRISKPRYSAIQAILSVILGLVLSGSGTPVDPAPSTSVGPARYKWEGPPLNTGNGSLRTVLYYGPWYCNQRQMNSCQTQCGTQQYKLMGCIWLADMKFAWDGEIAAAPAKAGTRYAFFHCCCNYPELSVGKNEAQRRLWDQVRERLRSEWSSKLGNWPTNNKGNPWSGHHVHDLKHGGPPASLENILPAPADTHIVFNKEYPRCYDGASWMRVGPDLPYTD